MDIENDDEEELGGIDAPIAPLGDAFPTLFGFSLIYLVFIFYKRKRGK